MPQTKVTFHVLVNEEPDGSYWSEVKELPGCFASGFSMDELKEATFEAMQIWLPDGIVLGSPTWKLIEEPSPGRGASSKAGKRRPPARRKMLVCA
jgi:predicted RNase H-like HicB family nuclease